VEGSSNAWHLMCLPDLPLMKTAHTSSPYSGGTTPLMLAAFKGHVDCMQLILAAHDPAAQVRAVDMYGRNSLMLAADTGQDGAVEMLLRQPCVREQLEAADVKGWTAVMWAARKGHASCIQAMLGRPEPLLPSALVMVVSRQQQTALHLACMHGKEGSVQALLAVRPEAQVRAVEEHDMTPLMLAACHSHPSCIKELLAVLPEAQTVATDGDGWTALMWAAAMPPGPSQGLQGGGGAGGGGGGQMGCILALLMGRPPAQGPRGAPLVAQLQAVSPSGESAVALATRNGHSEVARILEHRITAAAAPRPSQG
jgi:hypothetical protein